MTALRFLAISGSLRTGSLNTAAIRAAMELAPEGVVIGMAEIRDIPLYNDDVRLAAMPAPVVALQHAIAAADAVLIATPEYNFSVPGVLKNAIDWVSRTDPQPFRDKPVGIIGASMGALGTGRAQYRSAENLSVPGRACPEQTRGHDRRGAHAVRRQRDADRRSHTRVSQGDAGRAA